MTSPSPKLLMRVVVTMLAGAAWPFACGLLFLHTGDTVLLTQIELLQSLGVHSGTILKLFIHFTDPIFWAVVFGVLFGLPLGMLVRENLMRYWGLFLTTVVVVGSIGDALNGMAIFLVELLLSPFLAYQAGILVAWLITARVLSHKEADLMLPAS